MKTDEIIGRRIEERLKELGWEKKDLAEALDISPQMVSKITLAKKNITVQEVKKIANVLDLSLEELTKEFNEKREIESIMSFMGGLTTQEAKDGLKLAQEIIDAIIENREARKLFEDSISNLI